MTPMIGISFMSPVEKPIIIPLEYHRIDNEFTTTDNNNNNNSNSSNYSNNNQSSQKKENNIKNFKNVKKTINNIVNNNHISNRNNDIIKKAINNNNDDDDNDNESSQKYDKNDKNDTLIINNNHNQNNYYIKNELHNSNSNDNCNNNNNNNNENNSRISNEKCQQDNSNVSDDNNYPKYKRNRQIFGIQLEVTSLLLVAERRKLNVLQKELQIALEDSGSIKKAKENFKQELILAISRIQSQYDLLENEYKQHAIGRLRNSKNRGTGKSNRSQPAIGLKQTPKARPTIFGTVASDQYPKDNANKRALPQTTNISNSSSTSAAAIRKTNDKQISQLSSSSSSSHGSSSSSSETATAFIQNSSAGNEGKDTNTIVATEENSLVYRDGNLISGPLDALIQHMVPTSDYYPDRSYIFAFLLSARLFIRPYKLLEKICQLCEEQQNFSCKLQDTITTTTATKGTTETKNNDKNHYLDFENFCNNSCSGLDIGKIVCDNQNQHHMTNNGDDEECCKKLKKFAQNFVQLLAEWIDTFPYDFRDDRLMQHLRLMSKKCVCIDSNLRKDVSTMLQNLLHRLTVLDKYEEFLQSISNDSNDCPTNSILIPSSSNSTGSTNENRTLSGSSSSSGSTNVGTSGTTSTAATSNQNSSMQQQQQSGNTYHGQTIGNQIMNASGILHHTNSSSSSLSTSNCLHSSSSHSTNSILSSIDIIELCPNPTLLAHQLTHIELERLSHIGPEEFVQAFAKENPHLEQSFNDIKKTRNLESYIQWFNRLSYFVATEIVKHCKKKQRVRIVEYWIETARECFNIGNFNSLMAIIAGLNMSPISRLKKTWAKVQSAKFSVLEHQMDPSSNFNSYRSTLKAAMWRSAGATDERERIVIPFFSLLVKDLYFLNEGCSNKLANGHVNFEKFWQLAKQVTEFIAWKQVTCPFEKIPKVIMFLYTNHILNENMLALASFECEPPENHEKDRYKCLKSEQQQQHQQQQQQLNQQQQQLNQQQQQQHYHYHQQQ